MLKTKVLISPRRLANKAVAAIHDILKSSHSPDPKILEDKDDSIMISNWHLPQDILQEIFSHLTHCRDHQPCTTGKSCRWVVSHVCQMWRLSALAYPSLWARLPKIDLKTLHRTASPDLSCFNECLHRSGTVPVDICIIDSHNFETATHPSLPVIIMRIIEFSERWRKLELTTSVHNLTLMNSIQGRIPFLEELKLDIAWYFHGGSTIASRYYTMDIDTFKTAPRLSRVTLDGQGSTYFRGRLHLPYSQLVHYNNNSSGVSLDCFPPRNSLQTLSIIHTRGSFRTLSNDTNSTPIYINMPHLRKLVLRVDHISDLTVFNLLHIPAIEELEFCTTVPNACQAVLSMVVRASSVYLTKLNLATGAISAGEVPELLRNMPELTDLCLLVSHASDLLILASTHNNNTVLVPRLEHCYLELGYWPQADKEMGLAIFTLATFRCEVEDDSSIADRDSISHTFLRRLKTLKIRCYKNNNNIPSLERTGGIEGDYVIYEPKLQQGLFEGWSGESSELDVLKDKLLIAQHLGGAVDLTWKRRLSKVLAQIEEYKISNPKEIFMSNIHVYLGQIRDGLTSHQSASLENHAGRILNNWKQLLRPILKDLHWALARDVDGESINDSLVYVRNKHDIRYREDETISMFMGMINNLQAFSDSC